MDNNELILNAYELNKEHSIEFSNEEDLRKSINSKDKLTWIHIDGNCPYVKEWLNKEVQNLDSITVDALTAAETRPRIAEFNDTVLMILRGINFNEDSNPEDMVSIRLWASDNVIISVRIRKIKAVQDIRDSIKEGKGPENSGEFLAMLVGHLFERMEVKFSELDEKLDDAEERVIENPDASERAVIAVIRKQAIMYRRYIAPQRDVLSYLKSAEKTWLEQISRRRLQESMDRVTRYIEDLDTIRERAQIIKDELSNALADRMNKNLYVLSVIAAIFLPLGFLTGLLGINVGGIPGTENPYSFTLFCIFLVAVLVIQVIVFKKMKWF